MCSVSKSCLTLYNPMDCGPPGSSVHRISQARILEWVAISFSRGSSWPRDQTHSLELAGGFSTTEPSEKPKLLCCCSGTQSCPTLCDPMDCSTLGFPACCLPELAQTHVHWVGDAILPSHPLLSPSPAFTISWHQGLFYESVFTSDGQCIGTSALVSVLPMSVQDWFPLELTGLISL